MTVACIKFQNPVHVSASYRKHRGDSLERPFRKSSGAVAPEDAEREWFASLIWRILQRYYEVRAKRASRAAVDFKSRAEKFFNKINGASK